MYSYNMYSPLEQFEIFSILITKKFCSCSQITLSNLSLTEIFIISSFFFLYLCFYVIDSQKPTMWQYIGYKYFSQILQIMRDLITIVIGKQYYYSFFIFIFIFINISNLFGLIPYTFAITAQFSVTFLLAFLFFLTINYTGIFYQGTQLLRLFYPSGTPLIIIPLLTIIEFISYFARIFSLGIRLFANITAGHILLKILSWFVYLLIEVFFISLIGFLIISILWVLEFFISILQAYVFLILLCIYLTEVLQLH
jgi:F-type H+-transporting ATPase subunit a